jgi:predicted ATP-grasp superfamily ATP-dependent carboligase
MSSLNSVEVASSPGMGESASHKSASRVGAVVVGGDYQGLGIVRSLGRQGVPVCIVDDEKSIARFSRYATHAVRVKSLRDERECVETLLQVGRRLGLNGWVLYPTREETVAAFSRYRTELGQLFRVPTPEWTTIQHAWDKRLTYRKANDLGIPTPRTWYARDASELELIDADPPFAIKPAIKEHFLYATKAKAWRADTRDELRRLFRLANTHVPCDEVMVQELIPGDGTKQFGYCAFFKNGCAYGSMVVQRRRQHPPEFGKASTHVVTLDVPLLEALSEKFLRAIDYYGLVELEYKFDSRSNEYKLLDVNARTWGYHSIGAAAGVDFPYMLFADQVGQRVESCRARAGVGWIRFSTDFPTTVLEILHGRLGWREYYRSLRKTSVDGVFCREDLKPGLAELALLPYLMFKRGF